MFDRYSAIALFEFGSISAGIVAGDAMVKTAPLGAIYAGTVHPGKYLVLVTGDTASVDEAVQVGNESDSLTDMVFLPDVHPAVASAITGNASRAPVGEEALGVIETTTAAAAIDAPMRAQKPPKSNWPRFVSPTGWGARAMSSSQAWWPRSRRLLPPPSNESRATALWSAATSSPSCTRRWPRTSVLSFDS